MTVCFGRTVQRCDNWLCLIMNKFKTLEGFPGYLEWEDEFTKCER